MRALRAFEQRMRVAVRGLLQVPVSLSLLHVSLFYLFLRSVCLCVCLSVSLSLSLIRTPSPLRRPLHVQQARDRLMRSGPRTPVECVPSDDVISYRSSILGLSHTSSPPPSSPALPPGVRSLGGMTKALSL